jgi:flagellar basal-body rod protein FlgB
MVMFQGSTAKMLDVMHMSLNAATMRNDVLNNNIANVTTPNYKRQDITFQAQLERALDSEKYQPEIELNTTDDRHIKAYKPIDYRSVTPNKITEFNTYQNNNGNSVDIDTEMLESAKNTMYYNEIAQRMSKEFNKLEFLLRSQA